MRKILYVIFLFIIITTINVSANTIYSIDMNIYLDEMGNANITERWDVLGSDGTEWYKPLRDLGQSEISDFTVSMDGKQLERKNWNINESLSQKAGYYGINYNNGDTELCFGKSDFNRHTFVLQYNISNYIFNTSDAQVLYWTLFPKFQNVDFKLVNITIKSFYDFPDTLDVWGYGYQGYAYVEDGIIKITNEDYPSMNNKYVVALVKFPINTFNTSYKTNRFKTFDDVYKASNEGTFSYDYETTTSSKTSKISNFINKILSLLFYLIFFIPIIISIIVAKNSGYGYINNKKIDKKNTPYFRDIPCDKNIYYANALIYLNNFGYKESNILGAIILKWIREDKIKFKKEEGGFLKKEKGIIDLTLKPTFNDAKEEKLFNQMYTASKDGILEPKEFERWARNNYSSFFSTLSNFKDSEIRRLKENNMIYKRNNKNECKKKNVMNDEIYTQSTRLYGLKRFLEDFSSIDTKETLEVKLWDEYLMFAYLFGIADKVAKQIKNLYPDLMEQNNFDYDSILIINSISRSTVSAASSARRAAENYSSGGGGFSIGGGGGGSFGGGGFSGGGSR